MSYSALPGPTDLISVNSLHSHRFPVDSDIRRDSDSRSPGMSEPRSPLFRTSFPAELPPHLASLYNSPYAAAAVAAAVAGQANGGIPATTFPPYGRAPGHANFYPGMVSTEGWRRTPYLSQLDFCWPQSFRTLDTIVGPRTKAPREATSILKSWLNDHKDNPYPTKSEKMTLSIVTHMTLTQVSTWFANARRRIKKENKMTWIPKTRCGDRDGSSSNEEEMEKDHAVPHDRAPFAQNGQNSDDARARIASAEFDSRRQDEATSSTHPFHPDATNKNPPAGHPMFSALHRLHPQFYNAAAAAAAASFLNTQCDRSRQRQGFPSPTFSPNAESPDKRIHDKSDAEEQSSTFANRRQSKNGLDEHSLRTAERENDSNRRVIEAEKSPKRPNQSPGSVSPFVQLRHAVNPTRMVNSADGKFAGDSSPEFDSRSDRSRKSSNADVFEKESSEIIRRNTPSTNGMFEGDFRHNKDSNRALFAHAGRGESEEKTHDNPGLQSADAPHDELQKRRREIPPLASPQTGAFATAETRVHEEKALTDNHDALSSWIHDFQRLVASGQENKAKQALAMALAAAAKAGAYSGRAPTLPGFYQPVSNCERNRPFPASPNGSFSPSFEQDRASYRSKRDSCSLSSDASHRENCTPPEMSPPLRKSYSPLNAARFSPSSTPINLSKATGEWKRNDSGDEHSVIEA